MPMITVTMQPSPQQWQIQEISRIITRLVRKNPGLDEYQLILRFPKDTELVYRESDWAMALLEMALFENESSDAATLQSFSRDLTAHIQTMFQIAPERILILFSKIDKWSLAGHLIDLESVSEFFPSEF